MAQSLFKACKQVIRDGISGTKDVGGHDVFIEYYTQEDIDENVRKIKYGEATKCTFGDTDESKVVLVASPVLTIPSGFTLTPVSPKKSLVIICNTLINDGTISMTAKAPNVLPHDWYLVGKVDGYSENVVIPTYANNGVVSNNIGTSANGINGNNGTNRQCGSGGTGNRLSGSTGAPTYFRNSGSGYAFGGGAGSGGTTRDGSSETLANKQLYDVDTVYPMHASSAFSQGFSSAIGGVGNPAGNSHFSTNWQNSSMPVSVIQNSGCGGRIIIFCNQFINNGTITVDGTSCRDISMYNWCGCGGASGAGAIDIFSSTFDDTGILSAKGGIGTSCKNQSYKSGNGGNGSITISNGDQAPLWTMPDIFKPREKYMSKDNMIYFLGELVKRINND